jgi:putative transposase
MSGPPRFQQTGNFHFVTFSCVRRAPLLRTSESRDIVLQVLESVRKKWEWRIFAYAVMPEHLHLLVDEPERYDLANCMQVFKQMTSRRLKPPETKHFWLTRYHDRNVADAKKRIDMINYIHNNPVKRGLVKRPEDWKWSSYRVYALGEEGIVKAETEWVKWQW